MTAHRKVKWGVIGVARIATAVVIPAMQLGEWSEITAIASRDIEKAKGAAGELSIPKAYGSYEELIADPEIEAIYNPLPNHLHLPWTKAAAEAGKHVLCEKPLGMNREEALELIKCRDVTGVRIQEAFMVRTHPQWLGVREMVRSGRVGTVRSIAGYFSYFNRDPENIRNKPGIGGGGLLDIGCYPITTSRFVLDEEPTRVFGIVENDPDMQVDRLVSAILDYPSAQASFTCSTQLANHQIMKFNGDKGRIEVKVPFNPGSDRPTQVLVDSGRDLVGGDSEIVEFSACNQYTIQGDEFSRALVENSPQPIPLEDAVNNMAVIDAIFRSGVSGNWETPERI